MSEPIKAVGYTRSLPADDPDSFADVWLPRPVPDAHDLLVEVRAVSVNPVDMKVRLRDDPGGEVKVLGFDAAGVVREVGDDVELFAPGDEVFYAGSVDRSGTNAALHAVDERIVGAKPSSLGFAEAAALPLTSITAWEGLFDKLRLTSTSTGTLLVVGGAGGVGSMVLQLADVLVPDLRLIATASRPETEEWVRSLGADEVVSHREDLRTQLSAVAPDGVDAIFTTNAAGQVELYADVLRPFGQVVAIDDPGPLDLWPFKKKSLTWHWESMFTRPVQRTADRIEQHRLLTEVSRLVDAGRIRTTATTVLGPIDAEQVREAHRLIETGRTIGKIVIEDR
ncbi:MAG: zinc-binding alcohol dehydrogenase family protein [Nocardioidaceae bacterium]